jgi:ferritin
MVISEAMANLINQQIAHELGNENQYRMVHSWAANQWLTGIAAYFKSQADGEGEHASKFESYLLTANAPVKIPAVEKRVTEFTDCEAIARLYQETEAATTDLINKMQDLSFEENDYGTAQFLDWFSGEQVEEEGSAERFLNLVKICGGDLVKLDLMLR